MPNQSSQRTNDKIPIGITQLYSLGGHTGPIRALAWSPDGSILASCADDKTIRLWNPQARQLLRILKGHTKEVISVVWSPDGNLLASGSDDHSLRLWNAQTGRLLRILKGFDSSVNDLAWSLDGSIIAVGIGTNSIQFLNAQTGQLLSTLEGHTGPIRALAWSPDGSILASCAGDKTIRLWKAQTGQLLSTLEGHTAGLYGMAWSPDGNLLASSGDDQTIRLWNAQTRQLLRTLEGHTGTPTVVSFSNDGRLLASKAIDHTVRIWRITGECVAILDEPILKYCPPALAFHPTVPVLVTLGEMDAVLRVWDLDVDTLLNITPTTATVHYITAKIALVGDSGVGKSGLGYRIAEDRFRVTESTHGQQFWVLEKLNKTRTDGTLCETVLWDFAGQHHFRPVHALFLEDIDLALVLFDSSRQDTFIGVDYWLKQLSYNRQLCHSILIAARTDVSKLAVSSIELETFCREKNISGGFIATSAKTGQGVETLLKRISQQIDWDAKPATVTTETFKYIKDYVLALKAEVDRKAILVSLKQLRTLLEAIDQNRQLNNPEMITAVEHLQNHGYITLLRRSSNDLSILLAPDLMINLASSYILRAQANEKGLGALEESQVLRNEYKFPEIENLSNEERDTLLNAVTELFLKRNICFRETVDGKTFLIFPSLILERPPRLVEEIEMVEDITYIVTGQVENVYAALVVLLGYSPSFQRTNQWRKQAQYETTRGQICGFKEMSDDPSELELVLYYGENTPDFVRSRFQGLFEEILYTRNIIARKYAPIVCPKCGRQQEHRTVIRLMQEDKTLMFCPIDGKKIHLPKMPERITLKSQERTIIVRDQVLGRMRTTYETALVRVKGLLHNRSGHVMPSCFVSYAWGILEHEHWVQRLSDDLRKADVHVLLDQWDNSAIGASIPRFASRIEQSDFIIVVGTTSYRQKYENKISRYGSMVAAEVDLINVRLTGTEPQKESVLPVLLSGEERTSFPPLLHRRNYGNFTQEEYYFVTLFDLVLTLNHVAFDDPIVVDLRAKLREEVMEVLK